MALTVIGFFNTYEDALRVMDELLANEYDPDLIKIAHAAGPNNQVAEIDYDNTMEQAPVIEFKDATFGADITEEDAVYYSDRLDKGEALLSVHIPTDRNKERGWEEEASHEIEEFMSDSGAYDHEVRKVYSNRGLTTYPQNRWMDPIGSNKIDKDRIYESRSPLNGEVSNVIGVPDTSNYLEDLEELSGRSVLTAAEILILRDKGKL